MPFSFIAPTFIVLVAAATTALAATVLARRLGQWGSAVAYIAGGALAFFGGPFLWGFLSLALRAPDEPLAATGRSLSMAFYGWPAAMAGFVGTCIILATRHARAT